MKIIEPNAGALTNFEVLSFLRCKGAGKDPTRLIASVATSEYKVYDYLEQTPACSQTREIINECVEKCKEYDLAKSEILNIINIRPSSSPEMGSIIEQWEDRPGLDSEEKMEELVEKVGQVLPPAPKPEENESGEATDNGNTENIAEEENVET